MEDRADVLAALAWYAVGMDFADALHLAVSNGSAAFVSFDKTLAKTAKRVGAKPAVTEP